MKKNEWKVKNQRDLFDSTPFQNVCRIMGQIYYREGKISRLELEKKRHCNMNFVDKMVTSFTQSDKKIDRIIKDYEIEIKDLNSMKINEEKNIKTLMGEIDKKGDKR
jgi:hypothetical protein